MEGGTGHMHLYRKSESATSARCSSFFCWTGVGWTQSFRWVIRCCFGPRNCWTPQRSGSCGSDGRGPSGSRPLRGLMPTHFLFRCVSSVALRSTWTGLSLTILSRTAPPRKARSLTPGRRGSMSSSSSSTGEPSRPLFLSHPI
jgi:hypothetical protein